MDLKRLVQGRYHVDVYANDSPKSSRASSDSCETTHQRRASSPSSTTSDDVGSARDQLLRQQPASSPKENQEVQQNSWVPLPTGQRIFCDAGIDLEHGQHWLWEAFSLATMTVYLGWMHILLILMVAALFSRTAMWLCIGIWGTALLPTGPCLWEGFLRNPVWASWRRYFRFSVVFDGPIQLNDKKYVVAESPHGVWPLGQLIATSLADMCWPGHPIYAAAADAVFKVPLWRHVMTWLGGISASASSFRAALKKGSVGLVPGGIAELFMIDEDVELLLLRNRKGFVRMAVEAGADLVPVFHFGNSRLFRWGPKWLEPYARKHRVALGLLFGRWGLPFGIPNHVPIMCVVGAPIPVPHLAREHPEFDAAVDEAHGRFVVAMQELYEKYKAMYGWAERPLIIV